MEHVNTERKKEKQIFKHLAEDLLFNNPSRNMKPRKRLQLLICTLQIFHVLAEDGSVDVEINETTDYPTRVSSLEYAEYTTIFKVSDEHPQLFTRIKEFPKEATQIDQNERLSNDHLEDNYINVSTIGTSIDSSAKIFQCIFNSSTELQNNEVSYDYAEDEALICPEKERNTVQNLIVNDSNTQWISLFWDPPCETMADLTYSIDVCFNEKCFQINGSNTGCNVTNLNPCTEYIFTVKVIDKDRISDGVNVSATTDSTISEIGDVQDLIANPTAKTISLSWKAPAKYPSCVKQYLITQCFKTCKTTAVTNTEYISTNLEPCKEYTFIVKAVAHIVQSHGLNIIVKTNLQKPSKPQFPVVKVSAFSLYIHWQPPAIGSTCIKHYRVTISPQITKQSRETNVTINGLYACTSYYIYVNAVDEENNNGEIIVKRTRTAPIVSEPPILNVNKPLVSTNNILLSWKIERDYSNCNLMSLKTMCNYTMINGHGYEIVNGEQLEFINSPILNDFLIVNSTIDCISPYTTYVCWAYVTNEAGDSKLSDPINITTLEDIPSAPALNVTNITTQLIFVWEMPKYLAGNLHEFEIKLEWKERFSVPDWCSQKSQEDTIHLNGSVFTFKYLKTKAYTNYKAKIRARTTAGWGNYSKYLIFQTLAGVPDMVTNFSYLITNNENNTNILDTILTWGLPCSLNGVIEYFNIFVHGTRTDYAQHSFSIKKHVSSEVTKNGMIVINLSELKAEYNYTFEVSTKVYGVQDFGLVASYNNILYPAGIPPQPNEEYTKSIRIDPTKARRSTTSASLLLPLFPDTNGDVIYYAIIVSKVEYNSVSNIRFNLKNHTWPNISSWKEAMLQDFTIPYQATRLCWNPYPNYVADYGDMKAVKYTLGEDTNCKEISSKTKKRVYCNGPLKPNTWYYIRMRAFTRGGFADSTTFFIKTNAEINIGLVSGVVFGILFLGILATMMLLVRKCSPQIILRRFLHSDMSGSPVPAPFSKKKFIAHCQQFIDNPGKLSNEFQLLQTLSVDLQMPTNSGCLQANKKKNRYSDILPYDFSRVKLEVIDNDPNTDYINASFIKGYTGEDEYIACQGPKEETTFDFWRMVELYDINIIVMLTQLIEKGKEKCHQYFPTIKEIFRYENIIIKCISELDYRFYTQRTLVLQKENKKRNITHLHFKDWPDHDVPEDFDPMIHFCQVIHRNTLTNKGYIVIHCSAGVGRTGTLIAIDILLQHLRDNRRLDVFGTVYRLRHQRINMVQKESQYAYIYNCIKQVLKNPYCLKNYKPPPMDPLNENTSKIPKIIPNLNTNLVNNFEMCV